MQNRLGGSNEPFLNKPARFTELTLDNAVRRGKDRLVLETLIDLLSYLDSLELAEVSKYFTYALRVVKSIETLGDIFHSASIVSDVHETYFLDPIAKILESNNEGQNLTVGTYVLLNLLFESRNLVFNPHKLNQSGASSKEIADLDIFENDKYLIGVEIKDKRFTPADIDHAHRKTISQSGKFLVVTREKFRLAFLMDFPDRQELAAYIIPVELLLSLAGTLQVDPIRVKALVSTCADEINVSLSVAKSLMSAFN